MKFISGLLIAICILIAIIAGVGGMFSKMWCFLVIATVLSVMAYIRS